MVEHFDTVDYAAAFGVVWVNLEKRFAFGGEMFGKLGVGLSQVFITDAIEPLVVGVEEFANQCLVVGLTSGVVETHGGGEPTEISVFAHRECLGSLLSDVQLTGPATMMRCVRSV